MACNTAVTEAGNLAREEENPKRDVELGIRDSDENPWRLESYDQPGTVLVSTVLTGNNNYVFWSRLMTVALRAKGKFGFVNGDVKALDEHSPNYGHWKQTDCMVMCWIINSLSKEIMSAFIYAETAKDLWDKLALVFCQRNGLVKYRLKREIMNARQGSDSVMAYFSKLCQLWGELGYLFPETVCKCGDCNFGARDTVAKTENLDFCFHMTEKLIQFLTGLNESFDRIRQQILSMDPSPNIYRAYNMVMLVEEQMKSRN